MTVLQRVLGAVTAALLVVALAAGCGSDTPKPKPTISDASTTPAGYDATVLPERPADVNSVEGADAFSQYATLVVFYVNATGDSQALSSISDMSTCEVCQNWADLEVTDGIEFLNVAETEPQLTVTAGPNLADEGFYAVDYSIAPLSFTQYDGHTGEEVGPFAETTLTSTVNVRWDTDHWILRKISVVQGPES